MTVEQLISELQKHEINKEIILLIDKESATGIRNREIVVYSWGKHVVVR